MILCVCPNPSVDMFAWIETIRSGEVNRLVQEKRFPGGKGVHVAMAVAELGEPVHLLGFWGGATGQWIRNECEKLGVQCHGPEVRGWSRTCMTLKSDNEEFHDTELLGTGPTIDADDFSKFMTDFETLLQEAALVCMSGSWPGGAPAEGYAKMVSISRKAGKKTLVDATGEQLKLALEEGPEIVHMNRSEARTYFGQDSVKDNAGLLAKQCTYAAVTAGAEGLYLAFGNELIHASCHVEKVYSTVGSGDCLLAGMAVAMYRQQSPVDIARLGVACGAANCMREDLGMLYRSDVEDLIKCTEVSVA